MKHPTPAPIPDPFPGTVVCFHRAMTACPRAGCLTVPPQPLPEVTRVPSAGPGISVWTGSSSQHRHQGTGLGARQQPDQGQPVSSLRGSCGQWPRGPRLRWAMGRGTSTTLSSGARTGQPVGKTCPLLSHSPPGSPRHGPKAQPTGPWGGEKTRTQRANLDKRGAGVSAQTEPNGGLGAQVATQRPPSILSPKWPPWAVLVTDRE